MHINKKTSVFIILFFLLLAQVAQAQEDGKVQITGTVLSQEFNEALPGVNVVIKGASVGTITDLNGKYQIEASTGDVLVVSFVGYHSEEAIVGEQTVLNFTLAIDIGNLSEVVVIGYGTIKKSHLTGSVSKVKNEQLDEIPVARADEALIGKMAGVLISTTDARVGEASTIQIRGTSNLTGASDPLLVIDGVPVSSDFLGTINMADVESIEVLKDAASAAIYGSRGAAGVIMISTKKGTSGKTKFNFNAYTGMKSVVKNESPYPTIEEWIAEKGTSPQLDYVASVPALADTHTNWFEEMTPGGTVQNYSLSASGGDEVTDFHISGGYLKDEGILLTDQFEKYNARINLNTKVNDRVKMGMSIAPSYSKTRQFPMRFHDVVRHMEWLPIYHTEATLASANPDKIYRDGELVQPGDYADENDWDNWPTSGTEIRTGGDPNPYQRVVERNFTYKALNVLSSGYLDINLAEGLNLHSTIGLEYRSLEEDEYVGVLAHKATSDANVATEYASNIHWVSETYMNYNKVFGESEIDLVAGFSAEKSSHFQSELDASGFVFDQVTTISESNKITNGVSSRYASTLASAFGRLNYAYDNKYLASVSIRRDGSSRFGLDTKYGTFPAFSLGWRVSEEDFIADNSAISELKLRVSYGINGYDAASAYAHMGLVEGVGASLDGGLVSGYAPSQIANPVLKWQKSKEFSPGIDLGLFNNRVFLTAEYYNKTSEDLILDRPISSITGFTKVTVNQGIVKNTGVDIELTTHNVSSGDFKWLTSVNFSTYKNELVDFAGNDSVIFNIDPKRPFDFIAIVGQPTSSFYGWEYEADIPADQLNNVIYPVGTASKEVYVKDQDGDGDIDNDDKVILGDPHPDLTWALTNTLKYKMIDFTFTFQGSHGAEVVFMDKQYYETHWKGSTNENFPAADKGLVKQRIFTDDIVQNASYVSLRNLNLGFTLPKSMTQKIGVENLRIYFAASNLLYFMADDYMGYNPEGTNETYDPVDKEASDDVVNPLVYGYQRGAQPLAKSITIGLNLNF